MGWGELGILERMKIDGGRALALASVTTLLKLMCMGLVVSPMHIAFANTASSYTSTSETVSGNSFQANLKSEKPDSRGVFSDEIAPSEKLTEARTFADTGLSFSHMYPGFADLCDIDSPLRNMSIKREPRSNKSSRNSKRQVNQDTAKHKRSARQPIAPQRVFDNLYYVGAGNVASWAIDTGDSIVLIDALNNAAQASKYIVDGLATLGLADKPISHLIITHGHGDHYGGQKWLSTRYNVEVIMSDREWRWLQDGGDGFSSPSWGAAPEEGTAVSNGKILEVGHMRFQFFDTPGHTPGTLSVVFSVVDNGAAHKAVLWGGTGLNYGPDANRIKAYTQSAIKMQQVVKDQQIDVFLSNHPKRDGTLGKMKALHHREPNQTHPFVVGSDITAAGFEMLENCTKAQWMKIEALAEETK
ncbi:MBL fold metallo-hydrolase (modular protein) [Alteromonas sp. 38]|uniref:MBL fold metallo-hydrolase n=1 Tax=Alteromonas TaxID=226 RepID=UPI0012F2EC8E|nr:MULTISPECIES: MBL fold metallo-hydrolase [Alteromonas]CAD5268734.1 MBL fold metallo-hydrolase (modular protein) [Alteromonas sp. 154]VXC01761.1 MBL fold metallo-hydrolase (modular protein) [Alteromonas sp. 38]